jgi:HlyD family secretion protein
MNLPREPVTSTLPRAAEPVEATLAKRSRTRLVLIAAVVLAIAFFAIRGLGGNAEDVRYTTEPARRGDLTVTVTATGTLEPTNQVDVSSELSGIVRSVEVDFNDPVKVGQVVAQLDTSRLDAQVLQSKAALEAAQAHVREAERASTKPRASSRVLEHVRQLSGGKVPSVAGDHEANRPRWRERTQSRRAPKAAVTQAQATLEAQQTDLGKTTIRSPVDGIVLARNVEPGQTVASSLQAPVLFTLAEDLTHMELHVSVDEADVGQVKEGQAATFTVDAWPDRVFPANVKQVHYGSATVGGVVTYETVLIVDNSEGLLRPGMTATAEIVVREVKDAVLVPNAALRFMPPAPPEEQRESGGLLRALLPGPPHFARRQPPPKKKGREQQVWTLSAGKPTEVKITTGATDGASTEVVKGAIEPGTELVVDVVQPAQS